jgi:hypothetical protein
MDLDALRLCLALTPLGVSFGCAKSVEVIGFGPLESEAPTPTVSTPPNDDGAQAPPAEEPELPDDATVVPPVDEPDVGAEVPATDASALAPLPDASAPSDASAPVDAAVAPANPDAAPTSVFGPFGAPEPLEGFAGADDPSFTADGLEIYFDANDSSHIHVAVRASTDEPWGEPVPVDAVGEDANGKTPWITPDGLQLYFAAEREGGAGVTDLWWIERPDRASPWGEVQAVPNVNTALEEFAPSLSTDGLQLLFTRAEVGMGVQELWLARRDAVGASWNEPESLPINDPSMKDSDPVFSPDGLEVWWVHGVTATDHDLYFARRGAPDEPFAAPTPAVELNSTAFEGDPWLSADGREIVFFSTRTGERLLYRATR